MKAQNQNSLVQSIKLIATAILTLLAGGTYSLRAQNATLIAQQAYIKASNTGRPSPGEAFGNNQNFGWSVAIAGDTMAIGAPFENSNATGVNGNQTNNSAGDSGAAYVFVRDGTNWTQQAYLKASNTGANDFFGWRVAVSGDTVVVGAIFEDSIATGVNGNQISNSATDSGAAYVFVREGTNWSQQAYLKASNTGADDHFGFSVAVSGETIVVGADKEDSNATGVNGNQGNNSAMNSGAAYVFMRSGTNWSQQAYLKASNSGPRASFGWSAALSGDTLVVGASNEESKATGVNGDQSDISALEAGAAYVFVRNGTNWSQQAYLKASNTDGHDPISDQPGDNFGTSVAIFDDTVVVGAPLEASNATGVNGNQSDNSAPIAGAAYVFVRSTTNWSQQAYLKASNTRTYGEFGFFVGISGDTVVVGADGDWSNATGVNGNQSNTNAPFSGAAYVFTGFESSAGSIPPASWAPPGKIVAWGYNEFGQTDAPAGNDFVAVDGGEYHSVALRSDGSLAGWGSNNGEPDFGTGDVFYGQATVPTGKDFKAVAAGGFHSLALKSDGTVLAWGANVDGNGNVVDQAIVPPGLSNVIAIDAGDFHSIALKSDGSLVAWGDNSSGQTDVPEGTNFVAISSGDFHNLALTSDGSIVAWGENEAGQLNVPADANFVAIAAGWGQNLALKADGSMVAWGWNFHGQATLQTGTNFAAVAAGRGFSLALKKDGSLVAWGQNDFQQTVVPAGNLFVAIGAGFGHGLAIQVQPAALSIARTGNNIVISWPANETGYSLEASSGLDSPITWSKVPGAPTIVGNQFTVINSVTSGNSFYRLKK